MVTREAIVSLMNVHLNRVLSYVELAAPRDKFEVCRKLILDEFGREGFVKELEALLASRAGTGRDGMGGPIPRKEGGAP